MFLILLLLQAGMIACNRTLKNEKAASDTLSANQVVTDTLSVQTSMIEEEDSRPPAKLPLEATPVNYLNILVKYDLSPLFLNAEYKPQSAVYNGFYGTDHYRIEMYFASVTKDKNDPTLYHITGKSRYKKNITPFEGEVIIDTAMRFSTLDISSENKNVKGIYKTNGTFRLREAAKLAASGIFEGTVSIEFTLLTDSNTEFWYLNEIDETQGADLVFDGEWVSYKTGKSKPIIWAKEIYSIGDSILEDFTIGDRDVMINPKYHKLGWDNYWENDEWWNDSSSAKL
ncbi:hypothetical protein QNI16_14970 [Cytophagaceae bacterium YF14B1]|uniref:Uncharacterized protein n=1 Tax=Xanthocytophaga flava TaxID=3048013 RepID=A0AAE3QMN4_9BACT|nr:hypothetical protein [Xanthocytophaga flavus]MDJ1481800.1 hypothetical protein [Xanthocytophaga flavus]